jgi:hypothetical protein
MEGHAVGQEKKEDFPRKMSNSARWHIACALAALVLTGYFNSASNGALAWAVPAKPPNPVGLPR